MTAQHVNPGQRVRVTDPRIKHRNKTLVGTVEGPDRRGGFALLITHDHPQLGRYQSTVTFHWDDLERITIEPADTPET